MQQDLTPKVTEMLNNLSAYLNVDQKAVDLMQELDEFMALIIRNFTEVNNQNAELRADQRVPYFELNATETQDLADFLVLNARSLQGEDADLRKKLEHKFWNMLPKNHIIVAKIDNAIHLSSEEVQIVKDSML